MFNTTSLKHKNKLKSLGRWASETILEGKVETFPLKIIREASLKTLLVNKEKKRKEKECLCLFTTKVHWSLDGHIIAMFPSLLMKIGMDIQLT